MPGKQLRAMAKPTPKQFISQVDKGFGKVDILSHYHVIQLLLYHLDAPFSWEVAGPFASGNDKEPVAVVGTLTVTIDEREYRVAGVGQDKDMKNAESDAIKRAAMKLGEGLELWAQEDYWLDKQWVKDEA